jgi:hypothetical protein
MQHEYGQILEQVVLDGKDVTGNQRQCPMHLKFSKLKQPIKFCIRCCLIYLYENVQQVLG